MAEVRIEFPNLSEEQLKHLHKAERQLLKAGVSFDTGFNMCDGKATKRVWECDWSLKGAKVILVRK